MKKTLLALLMCMGILFCCACAEDAQISAEVDWSKAVQVKSSGPDNQQLAEQYVYSISKKPARGIGFMAKRAASMSFDGTQSRIYALLKADVALVAAGTRSSTQFIYDAADAYEQTAFTPEDLGLGKFIENGAFTDEAIEAIGAKIAPDLDMVLDAIMRDCPYEMYWFDKTISIGVDYPGRVTTDGQTISFSGQLVLSMAVSEEFQLDQQPFECNPAFGATAQAVSTRAQNIAAEHAALDDAAKLQAYKDDICAMTSYNYDAPGYTNYGNPWQLLWVFDDDPDTEVVCEGYAKAFQYLCNLSTFQDASVITVSGQMAGGTGAGDHMWNIARLPDGWNYLVDVTNCDSESIGWPNELMLAAAASGDVANGYAFTANGEQVSYAYDAETRSLYSAGELAVRCIVASGTCGAQGDNLTWTLDSDGTLTISGTGAMANYEDTIGNNGFVTSAPWGEYAASINSVVVSSGVTSIGNSAFSGCGSLTNITIPESVNSIGLCSFEYCSGLTTITIPDDVTSIGSFAFSGCTSLTSIAIPEGVTSIGESAFYGCSNLTGSITIPDGVTSIGSSTFSGCSSLTSIAIPEGVTSIGEYAFQGCSNLTGAAIPDSVTSIGEGAFGACNAVTLEVGCGSCAQTWAKANGFGNRAIDSTLEYGYICANHQNVAQDAVVAPTCTETGLTEGSHCAVCGDIVVKQEIVSAIGHDWSEIVYTWSADNKSVTATRTCARDGCGEAETETVAATSEVTKQPTCTAKGETTYTSAEFENEAFAAQAKTLDDVPALGHEWGDVVYIWSSDDKSVTAARACARDGCDEAETETAQYTFALAKAPTDAEMGETVYTATFENAAFDVEKTVADIPALNDMALLKLPAGLTTIDDEAFMGLACEGILIPDGCTSIGSKAFANCSKLVYVRIPAGVEDIAGDAFDGCPLVRIDAAE